MVLGLSPALKTQIKKYNRYLYRTYACELLVVSAMLKLKIFTNFCKGSFKYLLLLNNNYVWVTKTYMKTIDILFHSTDVVSFQTLTT